MLKYEIKLGNGDLKMDEMVWREKYLSPNLSYITGVTDTSYHLENFTRMSASNNINNTVSILDLECKNVKRQGYIIVKGKEYETFSSSTADYSINIDGEPTEYRYVINNDKYFYWGEIGEEKSGYTFNNLLNESGDTIIETIDIECGKDENPIKIDTVYWIEDKKVKIDGNEYFFDKNEGENGGVLKYSENGAALEPSAITKCDSIEFVPYSASSRYEEVSKIRLTKKEMQKEPFENVTFANYYYYVKYKDYYCPIVQKFTGDSYQFVCEIPTYLFSTNPKDKLDNLEPKDFNLYFILEFGQEGARPNYDEYCSDEYLINNDNADIHGVYNLNDLKNVTSFIYIDEEEKAYFQVEHDVLNANDGTEIILYLKNAYSPLNESDEILFQSNDGNQYEEMIYNSKDYDGIDEEFAIVNSRKYLLEKNMMDKVIINDNEYDIEYIYGKVSEKDCLVNIDGEKVPMKIISTDDGKYSSGKLKRYGRIISGDSKSAIDAEYDIKPYDGINVNGNKYIVYEVSGDDVTYKYAAIKQPKEYTFTIIEKLGNSTYVCEPSVNTTEFTQDFNRMICREICNDVVSNKIFYSSYIDNKIFGDRKITKDLPFLKVLNPKSSDDYYDLFNNLKLYVKNSYINVPLQFKFDVSNSINQENVVARDFFEAEKEKSINPIVDMEKDIYVPKYMENEAYSGSSTIFHPIQQINLNFHFRTRNLTSWVINDGNNLYNTSGISDNWFITDYHPYCDILADDALREASGDTLMESSDLMGLLNFTNDDIFYQKTRVGKSFARLSFYDSTDPQTQSLLATSCVFVDEHKLFKKYIDNSRKNERLYGSITEPIFRTNEYGFIDDENMEDISDEYINTANKISVNMECLGRLNDRRNNTTYTSYTEDCDHIKMDEMHRISSKLTIDNRYATNSSSEGFYLYIFREYGEKLHPKPIYMKIEFNHAGVGKQIPFLIPMHWSGNTDDPNGEDYNEMHPERALTLNTLDDLNELKEGLPLSYVYAQTYIPLYAVYDFINKEYCYVFDNRYVSVDENGVLNLNLFEMKIMDESQEIIEEDDQRRIDISRNQQIKAVININNQFNI